MTKHTPGPWKPFPSGVYAGSRADGLCVCTRHKQATDEDWSANAHLLAAAPDLLAAMPTIGHPGGLLVKVVAHYADGSRQTIDGAIVTAAVTKAEGRS